MKVARLGRDYEFNPIDVPHENSRFTERVYYCKSALVSHKQSEAVPMLLMGLADFKYVSKPSVTHAGAFGDEWEPTDVNGAKWCFVWKFPGDLFHVDGMPRHFQVWLPVGKYAMWQDRAGYTAESRARFARKFDPQRLLDHEAVKMRLNSTGVHYLRLPDAGINLAMLGSYITYHHFWKRSKEEDIATQKLIAALERHAGIAAFSCHDQHHALVLLHDIQTDTVMTPNHLRRVLSDTQRCRAVVDAMSNHGTWSRDHVVGWTRECQQFFPEGFDKQDVAASGDDDVKTQGPAQSACPLVDTMHCLVICHQKGSMPWFKTVGFEVDKNSTRSVCFQFLSLCIGMGMEVDNVHYVHLGDKDYLYTLQPSGSEFCNDEFGTAFAIEEHIQLLHHMDQDTDKEMVSQRPTAWPPGFPKFLTFH